MPQHSVSLAKKEVKKPAKEEKKTKSVSAKTEKPAKKAKSKKPSGFADDGLVIIDEEIREDKEAELEARKAYLEEARSQEVED
ncbi:MAG: hypothetical protein ACKO7N_00260 [Candidatus Nitrosotenuis sp.]